VLSEYLKLSQRFKDYQTQVVEAHQYPKFQDSIKQHPKLTLTLVRIVLMLDFAGTLLGEVG
jgi:hypothetical protein